MTTINEEYESLIKVTNEFIDGVISKKYLLNDEKTYEDIINKRFLPTLKDKTNLDKTKLNYIIEMFLNKRCIPAGSILSGLGNIEYKCSLSNCYYVPIEEDSLEGIFECEKELARTFSWRGGCGTSITILRPKDAPVKNAAKTSTGAVSFMPRFSLLAHDIGQSGRRGALLIDIDCRHPDLLNFIWCKSNPDKVFPKDFMTGYQPNVNFANISVQVTNEFIEAVKTDSDWDLFFPETTFEKYDTEWDGNYESWLAKGYPTKVYQTVNAKDILKQIAEASWLTGDPGIIFRDTMRNFSSCAFDPKLIPAGCNPCLPEWSPVLTPEGYKQFKEIKNEVVLDNKNYNCTDVFKTKDSADVYEVELQSGMKFWSTDDHEIMAFKNNPKYAELIELRKLFPGDKVKMDYSCIKYDYDEKERNKGYFCGFIFGDGSYYFDTTKQKRVLCMCLGEKQIHLEDNIINIFYEIFNEWPNQFYDRGKTKQATSMKKSVTTRFEEIFETDSKDKFVLLGKNINFQLGFIQGMIETDGHIEYSKNHKMVNLNQSSDRGYNILSQIQYVLSSLNIYSNLNITNHATTGRRNNKTAYRLEITDVKSFNNHFTLEPNKDETVQLILNNYGPIKHTRQSNLKKKQKIKSITKLDGKYPVYDISVPGPNKFVSSAIVISNCGEQSLNKHGNCLLAAIVLHKYVKNPYEPTAEFDMYTFLTDTEHLVYFLDQMIDLNKHPLLQQNEMDQYSRRIGIEFTGMTDMLSMMNMDYGSDEACEFIDDILFSKCICEIKTSIKLAKEKGHAPCFKTKKSRTAFIDQPYIQRILKNLLKTNQNEIINNIMEYGLRNSAWNTVGPTGSISIISDNCTSGIEPIYNISYYRKSRLFGDKQMKMVHLPLIKHVGPKILSLTDEEIKKKYHYQCAHEISYITRIKVQSTIQKWTDNSISSTINLNNDATIDDIYNIYLEAYDKQLKGITIFRDGSKKGILSSTEEESKTKEENNKITSENITNHLKLVKNELNQTHRAYRYIRMWKGNKVYITITIDNNGRPIEIFANVPYEAGIDKAGIYHQEQLMEKKTYWDTICRLISLMLRLNMPIQTILKQLDKSSPTMVEMPSIIAYILKKYIDYTPEKIEEIKETKTGGEYCQACGENTVIYSGGCSVCQNCGDSKCG